MAQDETTIGAQLRGEVEDIASIGDKALAQAEQANESELLKLTPAQAAVALHHPDIQKRMNEAQKKQAFSSMMASIGQGIRFAGQAAAAAGGAKIGAGEAIYQMQMSQADQPVRQLQQEQEMGIREGQARQQEQSAELAITQKRQALAFQDPTSEINRKFQESLGGLAKDNQALKALIPFVTLSDYKAGNIASMVQAAELRMQEQLQRSKAQMGLEEFKQGKLDERFQAEWNKKFELQAQKDAAAKERKHIGAAAVRGLNPKILKEAGVDELVETGSALSELWDEVNPEKVVRTGENLPGFGHAKNLVPNDWKGIGELAIGKVGQALGTDKRTDEELQRDSERAQKIGQLVQNLKTPIRKALAGVAVSKGEAEDINRFLGLGVGSSGQDLSQRLLSMRNLLTHKWDLIYARNPKAGEAVARSMGMPELIPAKEGAGAPKGGGGSKTVKIRFPNGEVADVPASEVEEAKRDFGGKVVK